MDTKDKRRDSRRQNTAPEGSRKSTKPRGKGSIFAFGRRNAAKNSRPTPQQAEEARKQAMEQAARQAGNQIPRQETAHNGPLPEEEVYRPEPTRERHSQDAREATPRQTGVRPGKAGPKKNRPVGKFATRRKAQTADGKRTVTGPKRNGPAIIYTQPMPFNRDRLLVRLLTIVALVLAFTMCLSIFFRVENVTVTGAHIYSNWDIAEASGIQKGDMLLTFNRHRAGARIRAELPYVDRVRFGIKLPDTVIIDIVELDVTYAIQATDGLWWFITSEGRVVEQTDDGTASNYTKIVGVIIEFPETNGTAVAWEQRVATDPAPTGEEATEGSDQPVTVTNADRLAVALEIVQAMESNDVVGQVAEVDVSDLGNITLTYGSRYEVRLGNAENLLYKIAAMRDAVAQMSDYQRGVLDVTFVIWPDKVIFTPAEE